MNLKKKLIIYGGIGLVVLTIIIVVTYFIGSNTNKNLSYQEIETKMIDAAKKYTNKNPNILPTTVGNSIFVTSDTLVIEGQLKEFSEYVKDKSVSCTGGVDIYHASEGVYNYTPKLDCGYAYKTVKLYEKIIINNRTVMNDGLYQMINGKFVLDEADFDIGITDNNYSYIFRGENVNNYIEIDEQLWRIVSIDSNMNMQLILVNKSKRNFSWDDRYNIELDKNHGVNEYNVSRIKTVLNQLYNKEEEFIGKITFSDDVKQLIVPMNLCIGVRKRADVGLDGTIECRVVDENQYIGLLSAHYFMATSLDPNCKNIINGSCGNYNYLSSFEDSWWLLTPSDKNTASAYYVTNKAVNSGEGYLKKYVRPVVLLGSRAIYASGNGTLNNPYKISYAK